VNLHRAFAGLLLGTSLLAAQPVQSAPTTPARQELASGSALLVDLKTNQVLYSSNADMVVPIASVTKLMTAMVVLNARQPLDEYLPVTIKDVSEMEGVYSRVRLGSELTRRELLLITLMSSENRAAATLAHHYPGGVEAFVYEMNFLAKAMGLGRTEFAEPTGLSARNQSSAEDLVKLIRAAEDFPLIGEFSSTQQRTVTFRYPSYSLEFRNTNYLVQKPDWQIDLTKTGFTNAAGRCLVMKTHIAGKPVAFVVLGAYGKLTHMADANRLKKYLETGKVTPVAPAALAYKQQRLAQRTAR
jgi:serine-type D-Ala-D-Ala endopeptidase (penicillin-binding protein 7)